MYLSCGLEFTTQNITLNLTLFVSVRIAGRPLFDIMLLAANSFLYLETVPLERCKHLATCFSDKPDLIREIIELC